MSGPDSRPTAAADGLEVGPEGKDADPATVDALARVLDPAAFDPRPVRLGVGREWDKAARQMLAREHAERALAAGYRPSSGGVS